MHHPLRHYRHRDLLAWMVFAAACAGPSHMWAGDGFIAPVPNGFVPRSVSGGAAREYSVVADGRTDGERGTITIRRVDQLIRINGFNDCITRANFVARQRRGRVLDMAWIETSVGSACDFTVAEQHDEAHVRQVWVPERVDVIFVRLECRYAPEDVRTAAACDDVLRGLARE